MAHYNTLNVAHNMFTNTMKQVQYGIDYNTYSKHHNVNDNILYPKIPACYVARMLNIDYNEVISYCTLMESEVKSFILNETDEYDFYMVSLSELSYIISHLVTDNVQTGIQLTVDIYMILSELISRNDGSHETLLLRMIKDSIEVVTNKYDNLEIKNAYIKPDLSYA